MLQRCNSSCHNVKRLAIALLLLAAAAQAHEVHLQIETRKAVAITLSYANGQPFAYEKYTLTPAGQEKPLQVGNTDAAGRIAFGSHPSTGTA